jgi:hypothetical protein
LELSSAAVEISVSKNNKYEFNSKTRRYSMTASQNIDLKSFSNLSVLDELSKSHPLAALWQERRSALVFVRHFG